MERTASESAACDEIPGFNGTRLKVSSLQDTWYADGPKSHLPNHHALKKHPTLVKPNVIFSVALIALRT